MPNLIFLFMALIYLVACEYSRLSLLLTTRDISHENFQSRRGEPAVFAEYFLASVQFFVILLLTGFTSCQNSLHLFFSVQRARFATNKSG